MTSKALATTRSSKSQTWDFDGRIIRSLFSGIDVATSTRNNYKRRATRFLHFCKRNGLNIDTLLLYKQSLATDNSIGVQSKNQYLTAARVALRQMYRRGYIPIDISSEVKLFQQTKKHVVSGLTHDEVQRICTYLREELPNDPANLRLRALVALLLYQGLRQCEITRLKYRDFDMKKGTLKIRGKGRDDYELIHLHPSCCEVLTYHSWYAVDDWYDSYLFPSREGDSKAMTTRQIHRIIKEQLFEPLGINNVVHGFRHYFTTAMIKTSNGNLLEVAKFTRHRSLEMLQVYNDDVATEKYLPIYYSTFKEKLVTV